MAWPVWARAVPAPQAELGPLDFLFFPYKAEKYLRMFFQPQHPHCPPSSGFLLLCLPFKGPVLSPCRLVCPPKLLPRQAWPGPHGEKLWSVYKLGRGGILRSTNLVRSRGCSSLAGLSNSQGWEPVSPRPKIHLMGNSRNRLLLLSASLSLVDPSPSVSDGPNH